MTEDNHEKR